jgi:membrane protease YdiL (CAAX protease family)
MTDQSADVPARTRFRLTLSIMALVGWVVIPAAAPLPADKQSGLVGVIADRPAWGIMLAALFVLAVVLVFRWRDVGLRWPVNWRSLRLLWLPALYPLFFLGAALAVGLPPPYQIGLIFLNTAFVAVSEELMFRGILFSGLRTRMPLLPAIILTTLIFGGAHLLNLPVVGAFWPTLAQAAAATMTGLLFLALRIRMGSLYPVIVLHAVWNAAALLAASGALSRTGATGEAAPALPDQPLVLVAPLLVALPNFLYALYLLRRTGRASPPAVEVREAAGQTF